MSKLTLQSDCLQSVTAVPDVFLDQYMPAANGEFVKVYLYLLKISRDPTANPSLSSMADFFSCTENDIVRALKYWEKQGLLALSYQSGEALPTGICFLPYPSSRNPVILPDADQTPARAPKEAAQMEASVRTEDASPATEKSTPKPVSLSGSRIAVLKENEEIRQLIFLAEQYLGRTLSSTDAGRLLYFYDELHFSAELLEYLIEYCVSKGSTSIHYIEKVGLAWHQKGITTVAMAKQETTTWNKNYFAILKAFGIRNRNPIPKEAEYMERWLSEYGFSMDLIREACQRTVAQTGQPSFKYAEGILSKWKEQNVQTMEDVKLRDAEHKKGSKTPKEQPRQTSETNRFNNFHQRAYDYSKLEEQLLNQ
ncbi:MAG: DnaD domain protein [Fusicatenibacter sp.]|nr:DnaD domain protein [Fusicatenibacter sp.]